MESMSFTIMSLKRTYLIMYIEKQLFVYKTWYEFYNIGDFMCKIGRFPLIND